jgi:hypothetical protein
MVFRDNKGHFTKGHKIGIGNKYRQGISPWNKGLSKKELPSLSGGRPLGSKDTKKRNSENYRLSRLGNKNPRFGKVPSNFKVVGYSYGALHNWIRRHYGKPTNCEYCMKENLKGKRINWANISGEYKRDRNDFVRLCVPCHRLFDKNKKNE